jgi:hypothetical protein
MLDSKFYYSKTIIVMPQTKIINWYLNNKPKKLNKKMFWEISITTKGNNTRKTHLSYTQIIVVIYTFLYNQKTLSYKHNSKIITYVLLRSNNNTLR